MSCDVVLQLISAFSCGGKPHASCTPLTERDFELNKTYTKLTSLSLLQQFWQKSFRSDSHSALSTLQVWRLSEISGPVIQQWNYAAFLICLLIPEVPPRPKKCVIFVFREEKRLHLVTVLAAAGVVESFQPLTL